jgi:diacylglycerol kinase family enzyme
VLLALQQCRSGDGSGSGNLLDCEGAVYVRARQVRIVSFGDAPAKVQVDGDSAGHTPVRFDVMKRRMGMIIGRTL